jgi:hypothetical protein
MLVWTDKSKTRFWYFDPDLTQWKPRGPSQGLLTILIFELGFALELRYNGRTRGQALDGTPTPCFLKSTSRRSKLGMRRGAFRWHGCAGVQQGSRPMVKQFELESSWVSAEGCGRIANANPTFQIKKQTRLSCV